jgi:hypothetical protein
MKSIVLRGVQPSAPQRILPQFVKVEHAKMAFVLLIDPLPLKLLVSGLVLLLSLRTQYKPKLHRPLLTLPSELVTLLVVARDSCSMILALQDALLDVRSSGINRLHLAMDVLVSLRRTTMSA